MSLASWIDLRMYDETTVLIQDSRELSATVSMGEFAEIKTLEDSFKMTDESTTSARPGERTPRSLSTCM